MKVAIIAPESGLLLSTGFHMCLAQEYMKRSVYKAFYHTQISIVGDPVILDNGAFENETVPLVEYFEIAQELKPTYCILPDKRFDCNETLKMVREALPLFETLGCSLLAVPQGNDLESILKCYNELLTIPAIDGFALYEEIGEVAGVGTRYDFCKLMEDRNLVQKDLYYHALGGEENIGVTRKLCEFKWLKSIDTAKPIVYGQSDMSIKDASNFTKYPHRPIDYFDIDVVTISSIINVKLFRDWVGDVLDV